MRNRNNRSAFTLVELMVVILIIGVLVGVLVPAVSAVRTQAKVTATKAIHQNLATALEAFKASQKVGGSYPPSTPDSDDQGNGARLANSPYTGEEIAVSGAGLLVWALSGADQLGSPGFKKFRSTSVRWSEDTVTDFNAGTPSQSGAYAIYPTGNPRAGQTVHPRAEAFVDTTRVKLSQNAGTPGAPRFEIEAERKARNAAVDRRYPMYLDSFGFPILYWRADPAGTKLADQYAGADTGAQRGIYHLGDNEGLLRGFPGVEESLQLSQSENSHRLQWDNGMSGAGRTLGNRNPLEVLQPFTFPYYIADGNVQAKLSPQRRDSYLLVSAGPDGVYGSSDDVTNFDANGR